MAYLTITLCLLAHVSLPQHQHENNQYLNQTVVNIKEKAPLKVKGKVTCRIEPGIQLEVTKVEGDQLWTDRYMTGWVDENAVILQEHAEEYFKMLVEDSPTAKSYYHRGNYYLYGREETTKKDESKAMRDYQKALQLNPKHCQAMLGKVWLTDWERDGTVRSTWECRKVLLSNPTASEAWE